MRKPLPILALLALAAAAPAQTLVIQPTAQSGFRQVSHETGALSPRQGLGAIQLQSPLLTKHLFATRSYQRSGKYGPVTYYDVDEDRAGWIAEFALPSAPAGASLVSATLSASAVGLASSTGVVTTSQAVSVATYAGDGQATVSDVPRTVSSGTRFVVTAGTASFGVTSGVASLLGRGASFVGVRIDSDLAESSLTKILQWSTPKLTLVYAPAPCPSPRRSPPSVSAPSPSCAVDPAPDLFLFP